MPSMRALAPCFAVSFLLSAAPESAAQLIGVTTCPLKVEVEERLTALPESWDGGQSTATAALASITFFRGPPSEKAPLKPDSEERQNRDRVAFWNLPPGGRGYWITCSYANTSVTISRRLPENIRSCAVTYERRKPGAGGQAPVKHILCR